MCEEFTCQVVDHAGIPVIVCGGRVDVYNSPKLKEAILEHIDAGSNRILIDLSKVVYIDSCGLGVLVGALQRVIGFTRPPGTFASPKHEDVTRSDGFIGLIEPAPFVERVLIITRLDKILRIFPDTETALAAYTA